MATITFYYTPDSEDNEGVNSARLIQPALEYRFEVPRHVEVTKDDLALHFDQWLRGLGYVD
jgi:hypothetical protein